MFSGGIEMDLTPFLVSFLLTQNRIYTLFGVSSFKEINVVWDELFYINVESFYY